MTITLPLRRIHSSNYTYHKNSLQYAIQTAQIVNASKTKSQIIRERENVKVDMRKDIHSTVLKNTESYQI